MNLNNPISIIFLSLFALSVAVKIALDIINYRHREKYGGEIPDGLEDFVDREKLVKINDYSNSKLKFGEIEYIVNKAVLIALLLSGAFPLYYAFIGSFVSNKYLICLAFFGGFYLLNFLIDIPFDLYSNFVLEKRFNFSKITLKLWISDLFKQIIISAILGVIILIPLTFFVYNLGNLWPFAVWAFLVVFSFLMQIIFPTVIAPLFNKFTLLADEELNAKIRELFKKMDINISQIFSADESKRTTHSNAYFTGIGKTKRIVLFDSLIENHTNNEILAILSHEAGHYKKGHIVKNIIFSALVSLTGLLIANLLINYDGLYGAFGFETNDKIIGLFLFSIFIGPLSYFIKPISSYISRKYEYQADDFSKKIMGESGSLADALKKLSVHNLGELNPAKIYSSFYYSHPPILDRLRNLEK